MLKFQPVARNYRRDVTAVNDVLLQLGAGVIACVLGWLLVQRKGNT